MKTDCCITTDRLMAIRYPMGRPGPIQKVSYQQMAMLQSGPGHGLWFPAERDVGWR